MSRSIFSLLSFLSFLVLFFSGAAAAQETISPDNMAHYRFYGGRLRLACRRSDQTLGRLNSKRLAVGSVFRTVDPRKLKRKLKSKIKRLAGGRPAGAAALSKARRRLKKQLAQLNTAAGRCAGANLQNGLVLHYEFEDDLSSGVVLDTSGSGHNASCESNCGNLLLTSSAPQGRHALDFGAQNDRRNRPFLSVAGARGSQMEPRLFSIAFWFRPQGSLSRQAIFGASSGQGGNAGYQVWYSGDRRKLIVQIGHAEGVHRTGITSRQQLEPGLWYHAAAAWDGRDLSLYLNGELDSTNYFPDLGPDSQYPVAWDFCSSDESRFPGRCAQYGGDCRVPYLGVWTDWGNGVPCTTRSLGSSAQMALDDLRMYDRPLSAIEARALFQGGGGSCGRAQQTLCPRQYGVCAGSKQTCAYDEMPGCSADTYKRRSKAYQEVETKCGDSLDNDCDGAADQGDLDCNPIKPSRESGVAPLAVFFDAIGNHDWAFVEKTRYEWDFGAKTQNDESSGGRYVEGYMAAHVFETPGEYRVRLSMKQEGRLIESHEKLIRVLPFSGRTLCVSQAGEFSSCPSLIQSDHFTDVEAAWEQFGANTSLLFRRGETWQISSTLEKPEIAGPATIGAYGEGEKPLFSAAPGIAPFNSTGRQDLRFIDVAFAGGSTFHNYCEWGREHCSNVLLLRVQADGQGRPFVALWGIDSDFFVIDSEFLNVGTYGYYHYGADRLAFIKTRIKDATSHIARIGDTNNILLYDNDFEVENTTPHDALTIRPDTSYARYSLIKKNRFLKGVWNIQNGPQNGDTGGNLQYQMIEENVIRPYPGKTTTYVALLLDGLDYVIRNNLIYHSGLGLSVGERDKWAGQPRRWKIYNNTFYSPEEVDGSAFIIFKGRGPEDIYVLNNIYSAERNWNIYAFQGAADPSRIVSDNNIFNVKRATFSYADADLSFQSWQSTYGHDAHSLSVDPGFAGLDPASAQFLTLDPGSPAIDSAMDLAEVQCDFSAAERPKDGNHDGKARPDIGAFEYAP